MKLENLLVDVDIVATEGDLGVDIIGITNDSRQVKSGYLFVAIKGYETDGHLYCEQAVNNGAAAIVVEQGAEIPNQTKFLDKVKILIEVDNSRKALAKISSTFYQNPTTKMNMIGITGTNGKTSTALLTYHILEAAGQRAGVIGTISNLIHTTEIPTERTTPEAHELQHLFAEMVNQKIDSAVMEVSSHALDLYRVYGIHFKVAAFTNLSLDHLDFHKTMENYLHAKSKLFKMAEIGVLNADDKATSQMIENHKCKKVVYYSIKDNNADFFANQIEHHLTGSTFQLHVDGQDYSVSLKTPGNFSVYNSLAAIAITYCLGIPLSQIIEALKEYSQVRGRFQSIGLTNGATAIVDYAHTPDGLENVLKSILEFKTGRVITVFGCGGDRDKTKRPLMAKIAEQYSDYVMVTSDNPRTENPRDIINDVIKGLNGNNYEVEVDRKKAIEKALSLTGKGDIVLIAGKGHEDYQIIGKQKYPFDDVEIVKGWR